MSTASGGSMPIFPIGLTEHAGRALVELVAEHAGEVGGARAVEGDAEYRTIETGFGLGLSGLCIAAGVELANECVGECGARAIEHRHTAIDPGQRNPALLDAVGLVLFERAGLLGGLHLIEEPSEQALPAMLGGGACYDLGFVDGAHWFENALIDIMMLARLIRPGGLLVVDDQWMGSVHAATGYARLNLNLEAIPARSAGAERFAAFRVLAADPSRAWDHWVPFECRGHRRGV